MHLPRRRVCRRAAQRRRQARLHVQHRAVLAPDHQRLQQRVQSAEARGERGVGLWPGGQVLVDAVPRLGLTLSHVAHERAGHGVRGL